MWVGHSMVPAQCPNSWGVAVTVASRSVCMVGKWRKPCRFLCMVPCAWIPVHGFPCMVSCAASPFPHLPAVADAWLPTPITDSQAAPPAAAKQTSPQHKLPRHKLRLPPPPLPCRLLLGISLSCFPLPADFSSAQAQAAPPIPPLQTFPPTHATERGRSRLGRRSGSGCGRSRTRPTTRACRREGGAGRGLRIGG